MSLHKVCISRETREIVSGMGACHFILSKKNVATTDRGVKSEVWYSFCKEPCKTNMLAFQTNGWISRKREKRKKNANGGHVSLSLGMNKIAGTDRGLNQNCLIAVANGCLGRVLIFRTNG